jgi:DNA polymerase-3 subunit epsilon
MPRRQRSVPLAPRVSDADRIAHRDFVATLGEKAIWKEFFGTEVLEKSASA